MTKFDISASKRSKIKEEEGFYRILTFNFCQMSWKEKNAIKLEEIKYLQRASVFFKTRSISINDYFPRSLGVYVRLYLLHLRPLLVFVLKTLIWENQVRQIKGQQTYRTYRQRNQ